MTTKDDEDDIRSEYLDHMAKDIDVGSELYDHAKEIWAENDQILKQEIEEESFDGDVPDTYPFNDLALNVGILNKREYEEWKDDEGSEEARLEELDQIENTPTESVVSKARFLELSSFTEQGVQRLSSTVVSAPNYHRWRRTILRQVFAKMNSANINLADRESVANFIERFRVFDPRLTAKFEKNMEILLEDKKNIYTPPPSRWTEQTPITNTLKELRQQQKTPKDFSPLHWIIALSWPAILVAIFIYVAWRQWFGTPAPLPCTYSSREEQVITKLDGDVQNVESQTVDGCETPDGVFHPDPASYP